MCGIAGFWQKSQIFDRSKLDIMSAALNHRGPDHQGFYFDHTVGLAHNRLSIIDLHSRANQPLYSHDGRFVMVYNGEVYNFNELASQFGLSMQTTSDSEIVLELFAKKGVEFVNYLNGMFAIAIYDIAEQRLFLFRDRVGIKPLFLYEDSECFAFASELKALQKGLKPAMLEINQEMTGVFLHLGFIPAPATIYKHIYKLQPGQYAIIDKTGIVKKQWWHIENQLNRKNKISDETEALRRLDKLVHNAVSSRLVSDVPVGTFLSGGIDSSLVSAIAARHFPGKIKTFTIGFDHDRHNEADFAAKIARHIGSDHQLHYVTDLEARELLPEIITQYDEPFADTSAIPTMLVSKMAKEEVTVTLSGDGGDELFMGYGAHVWARRLAQGGVKTLAPVFNHLLKLGSNRHKRAAKLFENAANSVSHIFSQEQYFFSNKETRELLQMPQASFSDELNSERLALAPAEKQALFDFLYYLPDDLLTKVDRASMRYALETRVPLLDYRIVEFAFNLHPDLRLNGKQGKYLLKKLLYRYVPASLVDRPKQGFSVPLAAWMNGPLKDWFDYYLSNEVIQQQGLVDYQIVESLRQKFTNPRYAFLYNRLWAIASLHAWFDAHGK